MSGYLQRMVQSVRTAGPIRPMMGSIFAGPRPGKVPDPAEYQEQAIVEGWAEPRVAPAPETAWPPGYSRAKEVAADSPAAPIPPTVMRAERVAQRTERKDAQPVAGERPSLPPVAEAPREKIETPAPRLAGAESVESSEPAQPIPERAAREVVMAGPLLPVISESPRRPTIPGAGRRDAGNPSAPRATAVREPDEIQIHIGRIEVTAALPAPVRSTPPKPAHKSVDLGAYLNRRRGRNG